MTENPCVNSSKMDLGFYLIKIVTANTLNAGTNSNVFITLIGSEGRGKEHQLKKGGDLHFSGNNGNLLRFKNKEDFSSGSEEEFTVSDTYLGYITHVIVQAKDGKQSWCLNQVIVTDLERNTQFAFTYRGWINANKSKVIIANNNKLPVISIDFEIQENHLDHHTEKFHLIENTDALILRRGQTFKTKINLARRYKPTKHKLIFKFETGKNPQGYNNSSVTVLEVSNSQFDRATAHGKQWIWRKCAWKNKTSDPYTICCEIFIPQSALPGEYKVSIETDGESIYKREAPIYILFNPWSPNSDVYMEDKTETKEYILEEIGCLFKGSPLSPNKKEWYFGQFEEVSLDVAMMMMERMTTSEKKSTVLASRAIVDMVCNNVSKSVLIYNFGDKETESSAWIGTPTLFEKFLQESYPVNTNNLWVISAVVTTIMRTLGIPCRPVTSYITARPLRDEYTINCYLDENGSETKIIPPNSIWVFHCWNEIWMRRPDLPPGYDGWQVLDALPAESANGPIGPSSLRAIKEGNSDLKYGTNAVLGEINSEIIYWQRSWYRPFQEWEIVHNDQNSVGLKIITKAIGSYEYSDITGDYKCENALFLEKSNSKNNMIVPFTKNSQKDIELMIQPVNDDIQIGKPCKVKIVVKNKSKREHQFSLTVSGDVASTTGEVLAKHTPHQEVGKVEGGKERVIRIKIPASHYRPYLHHDDLMIHFTANIWVDKTNQFDQAKQTVSVRKPNMEFVNPPRRININEKCNLEINFKNPDDVKLTNVQVCIDGTLVKDQIYFKNLNDIPANGSANYCIKITPKEITEDIRKTLLVKLFSKELGGITGLLEADVIDFMKTDKLKTRTPEIVTYRPFKAGQSLHKKDDFTLINNNSCTKMSKYTGQDGLCIYEQNKSLNEQSVKIPSLKPNTCTSEIFVEPKYLQQPTRYSSQHASNSQKDLPKISFKSIAMQTSPEHAILINKKAEEQKNIVFNFSKTSIATHKNTKENKEKVMSLAQNFDKRNPLTHKIKVLSDNQQDNNRYGYQLELAAWFTKDSEKPSEENRKIISLNQECFDNKTSEKKNVHPNEDNRNKHQQALPELTRELSSNTINSTKSNKKGENGIRILKSVPLMIDAPNPLMKDSQDIKRISNKKFSCGNTLAENAIYVMEPVTSKTELTSVGLPKQVVRKEGTATQQISEKESLSIYSNQLKRHKKQHEVSSQVSKGMREPSKKSRLLKQKQHIEQSDNFLWCKVQQEKSLNLRQEKQCENMQASKFRGEKYENWFDQPNITKYSPDSTSTSKVGLKNISTGKTSKNTHGSEVFSSSELESSYERTEKLEEERLQSNGLSLVKSIILGEKDNESSIIKKQQPIDRTAGSPWIQVQHENQSNITRRNTAEFKLTTTSQEESIGVIQSVSSDRNKPGIKTYSSSNISNVHSKEDMRDVSTQGAVTKINKSDAATFGEPARESKLLKQKLQKDQSDIWYNVQQEKSRSLRQEQQFENMQVSKSKAEKDGNWFNQSNITTYPSDNISKSKVGLTNISTGKTSQSIHRSEVFKSSENENYCEHTRMAEKGQLQSNGLLPVKSITLREKNNESSIINTQQSTDRTTGSPWIRLQHENQSNISRRNTAEIKLITASQKESLGATQPVNSNKNKQDSSLYRSEIRTYSSNNISNVHSKEDMRDVSTQGTVKNVGKSDVTKFSEDTKYSISKKKMTPINSDNALSGKPTVYNAQDSKSEQELADSLEDDDVSYQAELRSSNQAQEISLNGQVAEGFKDSIEYISETKTSGVLSSNHFNEKSSFRPITENKQHVTLPKNKSVAYRREQSDHSIGVMQKSTYDSSVAITKAFEIKESKKLVSKSEDVSYISQYKDNSLYDENFSEKSNGSSALKADHLYENVSDGSFYKDHYSSNTKLKSYRQTNMQDLLRRSGLTVNDIHTRSQSTGNLYTGKQSDHEKSFSLEDVEKHSSLHHYDYYFKSNLHKYSPYTSRHSIDSLDDSFKSSMSHERSYLHDGYDSSSYHPQRSLYGSGSIGSYSSSYRASPIRSNRDYGRYSYYSSYIPSAYSK